MLDPEAHSGFCRVLQCRATALQQPHPAVLLPLMQPPRCKAGPALPAPTLTLAEARDRYLAAGPWQCVVADHCTAPQPSHKQLWGVTQDLAEKHQILLPSLHLLSMLSHLLLMCISILVPLDVGLVHLLVVHQGLWVVLQGDRP